MEQATARALRPDKQAATPPTEPRLNYTSTYEMIKMPNESPSLLQPAAAHSSAVTLKLYSQRLHYEEGLEAFLARNDTRLPYQRPIARSRKILQGVFASLLRLLALSL